MTKCHFCGAHAHNAFYCNCGKVLPVCWDNIFAALGAPITFDLDLDSLRHSYYEKLDKLHPDKFHKTSEQEKYLAQECSSFLNSAYNTLRQPWLRAEYLLRLLHPTHTTEQDAPQELLLEVMEWREEMDNADNRGLIKIQTRLKEKEKSMLEELKAAFAENNPHKACDLITQFRFLKRSMEDMQNSFDK